MTEKSEYALCSDAANLLSFICQSMRNLKKEILAQSSVPAHHDEKIAMDFFTPAQIIEAREHPSNYVKQAINAVAAIQGTLNLIQNKIDACAEHRINLEKAIILMREKQRTKK